MRILSFNRQSLCPRGWVFCDFQPNELKNYQAKYGAIAVVCFAAEIFASRLTAYIGLLLVRPESQRKEVKASRKRNCPGQIRNLSDDSQDLLKVEVFIRRFVKDDAYFGM